MQLIVLCLCACVWTVMGQDFNNMINMPKYDSRYDYLDVDALFNSKRLVRNYVDCLINGLRCTPEGKALKRLLPEALRTKCVRCTERQKKTAVKIIKRLKYEYPEEWAKLSSKWDPTGDFTRYFEVFLANENFNAIPEGGNDIPAPTIAPPTRLVPLTNPPPAPTSETVIPTPTPPRPLVLNRFGDDGELMVGSPSSAVSTPRTTTRLFSTTRLIPRPTTASWDTAASNTMGTMFPARPTKEMPLAFSTAMTFIDNIGLKIIRTTELVTDILKNTVRAVIGR